MAIPDRFLDELIARTDIVDLVSESVRLTKKGRNYWGLCPFHSEKTPSFSVSADKQIYKCFGCGKGGGAINFVMELDNLPFRDAVAVLAKRAGVLCFVPLSCGTLIIISQILIPVNNFFSIIFKYFSCMFETFKY